VAESQHPFVSPLDGVVAAGGRLGWTTPNPGVVACEIRGAGLATVTARRDRTAAVLDRVRSAFAADLPRTPKRVVGRDIAFVWSGPDQWLAIKQPAPNEGMEALLAAPLAGLAALVDQSHGRTLLRVTGPRVGDALAKGVPLDLHPRAFMPGDAAATLLCHIPVLLWQTDAKPTYEFAVARSLAQSFWRWLATASAAYGLMFVDG
jgi:sarcosine oxidase subunit gamma